MVYFCYYTILFIQACLSWASGACGDVLLLYVELDRLELSTGLLNGWTVFILQVI